MKIKTIALFLIAFILITSSVIVFNSLQSLNRTEKIQAIWNTFETENNEKVRALIALRRELGYGGMIHNFKNYILRHNELYYNLMTSNMGGAKSTIARYKNLNLSLIEQQAIQVIEQTLNQYQTALAKVKTGINQGLSIQQLDQLITIDDEQAIKSLTTLEQKSLIQEATKPSQPSKSLLISLLRRSIGYGGMIHHFKDYLLHHDLNARNKFAEDFHLIRNIITQYRSLPLNSLEKTAINEIDITLSKYAENLLIVDKLIKNIDNKNKDLPNIIDNQVKIDDSSALNGLKELDRQIILQNIAAANSFRRAIHQINHSSQIVTFTTTIAVIFIILSLYWLLWIKIITPIYNFTKVTKKIAKEDLSPHIPGLAMSNEMGELARALAFFKDNVVRRQLIEQRLEQEVEKRTLALTNNETHLKAIIETAVDAIITIDCTGIIKSFNTAAIAMFGYGADEVIGKNVNILMPNPFYKQHDSYINDYIQTGQAKVIGKGREAEARRKNGMIFPVELAVSEVNSGDERIFTGIIRDISLKKESEQLILAKEAADKANKAKSDFLSSMSHELRTPLNSVIGFSQILEMDNLDSEQMSSVLNIKKSGMHLLDLIDDVLNFAKIEASKIDLSIEAINLEELINELSDLIKVLAEQRKIKITQEIKTSETAWAYGDYLRLKQILMNLLSNAVKYNIDNGFIKIIMSDTDENTIRIAVQDSGEGIPQEHLNSVFEPFNRLNKKNSAITGTGIGLTISKELVELMHGSIGVESAINQGSNFWIEIPKADPTVLKTEQSVLISESDYHQNKSPSDLDIIKILYIEDNPANMNFMKALLKKAAQYTLLTAASAEDGIIMAVKENPQIILMDIGLPGFDGYKALQILQDKGLSKHCKIIALSANAMENDIKNGKNAGFYAYLTKPVNIPQLLNTIKTALTDLTTEQL